MMTDQEVPMTDQEAHVALILSRLRLISHTILKSLFMSFTLFHLFVWIP